MRMILPQLEEPGSPSQAPPVFILASEFGGNFPPNLAKFGGKFRVWSVILYEELSKKKVHSVHFETLARVAGAYLALEC